MKTLRGLQFAVRFSICLFSVTLLLHSCQNDLSEAEMITSRANVNLETGKDV